MATPSLQGLLPSSFTHPAAEHLSLYGGKRMRVKFKSETHSAPEAALFNSQRVQAGSEARQPGGKLCLCVTPGHVPQLFCAYFLLI